MTCMQEAFLISKIEHLRELMGLMLSQTDDRFLSEVMTKLSAMEVDIWLEQDRRAGRPWTRPDRREDIRVTSNTAKLAL